MIETVEQTEAIISVFNQRKKYYLTPLQKNNINLQEIFKSWRLYNAEKAFREFVLITLITNYQVMHNIGMLKHTE